MASIEDIQELLAQLGQSTLATNDRLNELLTALVANAGAAAPPVLALQSANQTVRKSSETTVQLSLSDDQLTVSELGDAPYPGAAPPNDGFIFADQMGETSPAETEAKISDTVAPVALFVDIDVAPFGDAVAPVSTAVPPFEPPLEPPPPEPPPPEPPPPEPMTVAPLDIVERCS